MKKLLAVIGFILLLSINQQVVYAGTLNEYETEVIRVARGQFESHGITYQVDSVYIDELIQFLMQDDIDITAEQKDKAISIMFSNIEQGVLEGYLIPVTVNSPEEAGHIGEDGNLGESDNTGNTGKTDKTDELNGMDVSISNMTGESIDEFVKQIINQSETTTKIDKDKGKITVTKGEDHNLLTVNTIIKNTGFNLNITLIMAVIIFTVMAICLFITFQLKLYVHEEEKYRYDKS